MLILPLIRFVGNNWLSFIENIIVGDNSKQCKFRQGLPVHHGTENGDEEIKLSEALSRKVHLLERFRAKGGKRRTFLELFVLYPLHGYVFDK